MNGEKMNRQIITVNVHDPIINLVRQQEGGAWVIKLNNDEWLHGAVTLFVDDPAIFASDIHAAYMAAMGQRVDPEFDSGEYDI